MRLADQRGGVDFIVHDDEDALAARGLRGRDPRGGEKIGGAVGARLIGPAHRRRQDDRRLRLREKSEREGGLLQRVRAMGDDDSVGGLRGLSARAAMSAMSSSVRLALGLARKSRASISASRQAAAARRRALWRRGAARRRRSWRSCRRRRG